MSYFFESSNITINWMGENLSQGWAEDTFLEITPNSERVAYKAGADGTYTFSKKADKGCTISLTLTDVAPLNKIIGAYAGFQDLIGNGLPISPFVVVDGTGNSVNFIAENCVLTEVPDISFGAESGERTWTWVCETYIMSSDPTTITSKIKDYIKTSEQDQGAPTFNQSA